jgi:sigma-B regulation protein RsbU (phosphoserine phosphatase)
MTVVPAPTTKIRSHVLGYSCLAALFLISTASWARNTSTSVDYILHGEELVQTPFDIDPITWRASDLAPEAEAAGLRSGDIVVAVDGHPVQGLSDLYGATRRARLGDRLRVRVRSATAAGPIEKDLSIELRPFTYLGLTKARSSAFPWIILPSILLPLFCIILGFWVAAVRVRDGAAWLLLVLMLGFGNTITEGRVLFGNEDALQPFLTAFVLGFVTLAPLALVFFGIVFPERLPFDRRFPWIKWLVFGPLLIEAALTAVVGGLVLHHLALARVLWPFLRPLEITQRYLTPAAFIVFFLVLALKTATAQNRDARRRLLLLDVGTAIGVAPFAILDILDAITRTNYRGWPLIVAIAMLVIFPLTMAYVIVVHRAMDVSVVIRQGLQYLLATNSIRVLQVAIGVAIIIMAATMSAGTSVPRRILFFSVGFALLASVRAFAQRLRGWLDRRFFREAYETDAILSELATGVRTMMEIGPLLETVAVRIAESLHVPRIAILLEERGAFRTAYALGYETPPSVAISEQSVSLKRLRKQQHALVDFSDADSWVQLTDEEESASLHQLQPELLLPISVNEKVLGIMSLGTKQSEEPFSNTDIRLLDSVAVQTGLALENGRLTQAIAAEVAVREKHKRELEIAHEVQERLFPQEYPPVAGIDYAGACRPALGVGGDYYDFILLSKTELGIAVGDVSGKGIPAALLMATLRAYLRAQTFQRNTDLTEVMTNLNKLVFESSDANRYATFFYGEYDADSRALNYVNAGHNPPILFRQKDGGREVVRLDTGGPVIGLMEDCVYSQGSVVLEPGDMLVGYTDGISEAMNAADEEWGEERLMRAVFPNRMVSARELIERLMISADAFVAGAPQHDDMTFSIVRVI